MLVKLIILVFFLLIIISLGSALFNFMKKEHDSGKTARALTWRIGLSLTLFALLVLGYYTGVIHPHAGPSIPH